MGDHNPSRGSGFDVNKGRIGSGHNRYHVVPFGGKTTRFRGPQVTTVYPAVPFGGETAEFLEIWIVGFYGYLSGILKYLRAPPVEINVDCRTLFIAFRSSNSSPDPLLLSSIKSKYDLKFTSLVVLLSSIQSMYGLKFTRNFDSLLASLPFRGKLQESGPSHHA
ncbi:hypothetical protein IEQ34_006713 [Dendrobium chrysotoxum]|uniref:Uncharacterized protein n=1 Tax=Dendrobium chrysotoxum TaxID=161865 RepID=A0AAV7H6A5_DENCH|nr:hypothetical protein IEQ34_006713 [Dendrobium chrysotoxum]